MALTTEEKIIVETVFEENRKNIKKFLKHTKSWYHDGDGDHCVYLTNMIQKRPKQRWSKNYKDYGLFYKSETSGGNWNHFNIENFHKIEDDWFFIHMPIKLNESNYFDICKILFKMFNIKKWDTNENTLL